MDRRGRTVRVSLLPVLLVTLLVGRATVPRAGICPQPSASSLHDEPAVEAALDEAWAASQPGTDDAHEEGGFILQCMTGPGVEYVIQKWPPGGFASIGHGPPDVADGCRLVGEFHTHPPAAAGSPKNDGYRTDVPSDSDETNAEDYGVPGILVYAVPGQTDPQWSNYGPREPGTDCPDQPPSALELAVDAALSAGEPHLRTFDGYQYDFQAAGEFVLTRDTRGGFEVQTRQEPVGGGHVTMNTAVVARIDGSVVEVGPERVVVDGTARDRVGFTGHTTPGGGRVTVDGGTVDYRWSDGSRLSVVGPALAMVVADGRRGHLEGLLGDADRRPGDDLVGAGGKTLLADGRLTTGERYGPLADAWRVTDTTTLFTYAPGRSRRTFDRREFPVVDVRRHTLDPAELARRRRACAEAGVGDPDRLEWCAFDTAATGQDAWIGRAADLERTLVSLTGGGRRDPALVVAVRAGDERKVASLLSAGADPDATDADGRTALMAAVLLGRADVVGTLLDAGADPDAADAAGSTPLHVAARFGMDSVAARLVAARADVDARDRAGRTPADVAREQGHDALAARLR